MLDKIIGVYQITNILNGKIYIGSSIDIRSRWKEHKRDLKNNKHHSLHLQRSWNKNGTDGFEFSVLEKCKENETLTREQYYLDTIKPFKKEIGYNTSKDALAPMKGRKHSKETLIKLSEGVRNRDSSCWSRGEDKFNTKFKNEDIIEIKKLISEGCRTIDIANLYNVEGQTITQIKTGDRWGHIKTEYDDSIIQTPRQKLTEEDVLEIKKLLVEEKLTIVEIADMYNLTFGNISSIKRLKTWKNVGEEYNLQILNRASIGKLNKDKVIEIKKHLFYGKSCAEISKIYNVSSETIHDINNGDTWKDVIINEDVKDRIYYKKGSKPNTKIPIIQLSIDGELVKQWDSASDASKVLNIDPSSIAKCCKGKQLTYKGYKWMYKSELHKDDLEEVI